MKFQSLIAAALLGIVVGAAFLLPDESGTTPAQAPLARAAAGYVTVYRNGDLELNLRGAPGIDVLRSGLANLFGDDHPRTPQAWPQGADERRICAETGRSPAGQAERDGAPASEPLSLGMLGASFALLGWTRRRGGWIDRLKGRQGWRFDLFPWPALCWLD